MGIDWDRGGIAILVCLGLILVVLVILEVHDIRRRKLIRERTTPPSQWSRPFSRW